MKITVMTREERFITLDVEADEVVENVKALLEVETSIPLDQQQLLYHGKELVNSTCLRDAGIVEGDLIMLTSISVESLAASDLALNPDGSAVNPKALQQHLHKNPHLMRQLLERNPLLAQAILGDNIDSLQNILKQQHQERLELQRRQQQEFELLNADPFDIEAQKKIEEAIQQNNIDENLATALEYNPEAFARVIMLYVDMEVNAVPIKAFIDSGAQITIISKTCAERCRLLRLLDKRYVGIAKGVGQSEIVGRIHVAPIKIGKNFYPCSFTVLDQPNPEFIFGLDMLRKHQCCIDLKENVLRVGGGEISVPFLQERDLPPQFHEEEAILERGLRSSVKQQELSPSSLIPQANSPEVHAHAHTQSSLPSVAGSSGGPQAISNSEEKIRRLVELGFDRASVVQALSLFNGNEEQAASFLFGG